MCMIIITSKEHLNESFVGLNGGKTSCEPNQKCAAIREMFSRDSSRTKVLEKNLSTDCKTMINELFMLSFFVLFYCQ